MELLNIILLCRLLPTLPFKPVRMKVRSSGEENLFIYNNKNMHLIQNDQSLISSANAQWNLFYEVKLILYGKPVNLTNQKSIF